MSNCVFCDELKNPNDTVWDKLRDDLPLNRKIYEDECWVIVPPLGCFTIGGLLFISKRHISSCSYMNEFEAERLEKLILVINDICVKTLNRDCFFFEHGPGCENTKGACCVDHAHINCFPIENDISNLIPNNGERILTYSLNDIQKAKNKEYLWYKKGENNGTLQIVDSVPSQFIRKVMTKNMNFPERGDWKNYLGLKEIEKTFTLYKSISELVL